MVVEGILYDGNESSPSLARNVPWDFKCSVMFPVDIRYSEGSQLSRLLYFVLCMHSVEWVDDTEM